MKQIINDFINSIDTKLYSRIRGSMGDAECRRYLKEHLQKQLTIHSVVKPFYCVDNCKSKGSVNKCDNQCTGCWQVEKRSKQ